VEDLFGMLPEILKKAFAAGDREIYLEAKPVDVEKLDYRLQIEELRKQA
jgi:hypothetical protein